MLIGVASLFMHNACQELGQYLLWPKLAGCELGEVVVCDGEGQVRLVSCCWLTLRNCALAWPQVQRPLLLVDIEDNETLQKTGTLVLGQVYTVPSDKDLRRV